MNARSLVLVVTSFAALTASFGGKPPLTAPGPYAYTITQVSGGNKEPIDAGSAAIALWQAFGWPAHRASDTVWFYDFRRPFDPNLPPRQGCNILVVTLNKGCVVDMKVVNRSAANIIAACAAAGRPVAYAPPPEDSNLFARR